VLKKALHGNVLCKSNLYGTHDLMKDLGNCSVLNEAYALYASTSEK